MFLRMHRPSVYIFPAGNGDSTYFEVAGFNVLVNGGALVRYVYGYTALYDIGFEYIFKCFILSTDLSLINQYCCKPIPLVICSGLRRNALSKRFINE